MIQRLLATHRSSYQIVLMSDWMKNILIKTFGYVCCIIVIVNTKHELLETALNKTCSVNIGWERGTFSSVWGIKDKKWNNRIQKFRRNRDCLNRYSFQCNQFLQWNFHLKCFKSYSDSSRLIGRFELFFWQFQWIMFFVSIIFSCLKGFYLIILLLPK